MDKQIVINLHFAKLVDKVEITVLPGGEDSNSKESFEKQFEKAQEIASKALGRLLKIAVESTNSAFPEVDPQGSDH